MNGKGQSAIEYLMTYGWMLMVVAIVGGAIYSIVQQGCQPNISGVGGQDVYIEDYGSSTNGDLKIELMNANDEPVEIKSIKLNDSDTGNQLISLNQKEAGVTGSSIFTLPGIEKNEECKEIPVEIVYDTNSLESLTAQMTIRSRYEPKDRVVAAPTKLKTFYDISDIDNGEVEDLAGSSNTAEVIGDVKTIDSSRGRVASFKGGYLLDESPDLDNRITFVAWIKVDSSGDPSWDRYVSIDTLNNNNNYGNQMGFFWDSDGGSYDECSSQGCRGWFYRSSGAAEMVTETSDISQGEWMMLTGVVTPEGVEYYENSTFIGSKEFTVPGFSNTNTKLSIAARSDGVDSMDGKIDQVRIYRTDLSQEEIRKVYQRTRK